MKTCVLALLALRCFLGQRSPRPVDHLAGIGAAQMLVEPLVDHAAVNPPGQLVVRPGSAGDLLLNCSIAGLGIVMSFDDWLAPHFESGALEYRNILKASPQDPHATVNFALCLFELSALAITDPTARGDFHGNVDAVRQAKQEDPRRKIYDGPRAVTPVA